MGQGNQGLGNSLSAITPWRVDSSKGDGFESAMGRDAGDRVQEAPVPSSRLPLPPGEPWAALASPGRDAGSCSSGKSP